MPEHPRCSFLIPGDWSTRTGGYAYDRRLVLALRDAGWQVDVHALEGRWPWPDAATLGAAERLFDQLPDARRVIADGLAFGALPGLVRVHAERLRWVALVHHPLHLETGLDAPARQGLRAGEARALQAARQVVVTSPATARDVAALGVPAARIAVVEPGTDPVPPGPAGDDAARAGGGPLQLLCVATLTPRKGHALLLQALEGLAGLDWTLHCVGSPDRDPLTAAQLHQRSRSPALAGRVHWHGELDAAALQARYAAADLFVLPSLHEGYGMVVAEALAQGLPVLASRAGALADTLPPTAGLLVPPADVAALQAGLAQLLTDPGLRTRLAAGARTAARQLPTWPRQAARFAALLASLP